MVSREHVDFFAYGPLSHPSIRRNLLGRKVPGNTAHIDNHWLAIVDNSDLAIFEGRGITVGEVIRLYPTKGELDLVNLFYNPPESRRDYAYDFVKVQVQYLEVRRERGELIRSLKATDAATPKIPWIEFENRYTRLRGVPPNVSGIQVDNGVIGMDKTARMIRAQFLKNPNLQSWSDLFYPPQDLVPNAAA